MLLGYLQLMDKSYVKIIVHILMFTQKMYEVSLRQKLLTISEFQNSFGGGGGTLKVEE